MSEKRLTHEEYQEKFGDSVIPYNFDEGPYDGVRCPDCELVSDENDWDWVDTDAYMVEDSVDVDVTGVTIVCPECESRTTFR